MSENIFNLMIERGIQRAVDHIKAGKASLGPNLGRKPISAEKQLEAYLELTTADKVRLIQEHGPEKFASYVMENEARLRRKRESNGSQATG